MPRTHERRHRPRGRVDRHRRDLTAARRQAAALFAIDTAIDAGFALRAPGGGDLDILIPLTVPNEVREPIITALTRHKAEVTAILEHADPGQGQAQVWVPRRGTRQ